MLKKITLILLLAASGIICGAEEAKNLIPNPDFADNFKGWYLTQKKAFSVKDGVLSIKGLPELGEKNGFVKCAKTLRLPKDKISAKKFTFGITLNVKKISGKLMIAVRQVDAKGKSITYSGFNLKKRAKYDWKKLTKTFTASPKAVKIGIYIVSRYLQGDDDIQLKDIYLHSAE